MFPWGQQLLERGQNMLRSIQENSSDSVQEFMNTLNNPPSGDIRFVSGEVPFFRSGFSTSSPNRSSGQTTGSTNSTQGRVDVNLFFEQIIGQIQDTIEQIHINQATYSSQHEQEEEISDPLPDCVKDALKHVTGTDIVLEFGRDYKCPICLEEVALTDDLIQLPCNHGFHSKCLETWFRKKSICPICRKQVKFDECDKATHESHESTQDKEDRVDLDDQLSNHTFDTIDLDQDDEKNIRIRIRDKSSSVSTIYISNLDTPRDIIRKHGQLESQSVLCANRHLSMDIPILDQNISENDLLIIW